MWAEVNGERKKVAWYVLSPIPISVLLLVVSHTHLSALTTGHVLDSHVQLPFTAVLQSDASLINVLHTR